MAKQTVLVLTNSNDGEHSGVVIAKLRDRGGKVFRPDVDSLARGEIVVDFSSDTQNFQFNMSGEGVTIFSSEKNNPSAILKGQIAYLIDRVRMNEKKKQLFGTQFIFDKTGIIYNRKDLNKRRKKYGLSAFEPFEKAASAVRRKPH